jgi:uncharacterized protein
MDKQLLAGFLNPRKLELIVFPTEQCNFRCTYCYEDFEIGMMKPETVQAIKKLISARVGKLDQFMLKWFGGEPLLAKNIVLELSDYAKQECAKFNVQFFSGMTTNAFGLDRNTFDNLVDLNIKHFQISIDGDEEEHNKTRKLMSGRGTFKQIWKNLLAIRSSEAVFTILLRLHIHADNVDSIVQLLPRLQAEFGSDPRFEISLYPVGNWGGESVKQMSLTKNKVITLAGLKLQLVDLGWFGNRPVDEHTAVDPCYASKPNAFTIRADATLGKCTVALSDKRNNIGRINDDGTLTIESEKVQPFMRGFSSLVERELECPMQDMAKISETKVIKFERKNSNSDAVTQAA